MTGTSQGAPWFDEFKKLNASASPSASSAAPAPVAAPPTPPAAPKGSNRRRHERFEIDGAHASLVKDGVLTLIGVGRSNRARSALDLSEGGVRFLCGERLPVGARVRIAIEMDKYKDHIEADGEVKWCYQSGKRQQDFYAGVQFSGLPASEGRKISVMREWFTSPQYRAVRETKARDRRGDGLVFPK